MQKLQKKKKKKKKKKEKKQQQKHPEQTVGSKAIIDDKIMAKILEHNQNQSKKLKHVKKNQLHLNQAQVETSQKGSK